MFSWCYVVDKIPPIDVSQVLKKLWYGYQLVIFQQAWRPWDLYVYQLDMNPKLQVKTKGWYQFWSEHQSDTKYVSYSLTDPN